MSHVSCLMSHVSCLMSHVSCLMSAHRIACVVVLCLISSLPSPNCFFHFVLFAIPHCIDFAFCLFILVCFVLHIASHHFQPCNPSFLVLPVLGFTSSLCSVIPFDHPTPYTILFLSHTAHPPPLCPLTSIVDSRCISFLRAGFGFLGFWFLFFVLFCFVFGSFSFSATSQCYVPRWYWTVITCVCVCVCVLCSG